jgi:general secretion pathway protein D
MALSARGQTNPPPATPAATVVTNVESLAPASTPVPTNATPTATVEPAPSIAQQLAQVPAQGTNIPVSSPATNAAPAPEAAAGPAGIAGVAPDSAALPSGTNGLRLNFRGASLDQVLNYLSEAAGFIIVLDAQPRGRVDVFSNTPVTKEEAVNLLNQALKKNGYAAIRNGRTLTIVPRDEAKIHDIPVYVGGDPDSIPKTDEIVTQIIPVRFVEVAQLVKDIQPLVSTQTTMTANESGNEIVITDTQANIHKVAEIIRAIDAGAEDVTVVRVFRLNYADPSEMSDLLVNLFPDDSRSGGSSAPVQFGGFGGFRSFFRGGGMGGAPGGSSGSNNSNQRIKKRARVVAVADPRTSSLVVSAAKDLMDQITEVINELDSNPAKKKNVRVFKFDNADPQQAMQVLQDIFQKSGTQNSRNSANQNSILTQRSLQSGQYNSSSSGSSNNRRSGSSFGQ